MALGSGRRIVVEFIGDASSLRANARSGEAALQGFSGKAQAAGRIAGKALAGGLLLAAGAAVKMTQAAADDQAGAARLAQQLKQGAGATDAQVASTEEWITAQGKAKGVADDDLRPALAKLATATGSVDKAQRLATLAMSISAGSGKSLEQVTTALAKAQTGSTAGLAKFGIVTKDVASDSNALKSAQISVTTAQTAYTKAVKDHGAKSAEAGLAAKKLSLAQDKLGDAQKKTKSTTIDADTAISRLSAKYKGDAAAAADTTAGKQKILAVQFQELQEQIGAKLLPVMLKLADAGLKVVSWISENTKTAGILVASLFGLLAVVTAVGAATKAWTAITTLWSAATKVATAAQWLFNAAMDANPVGLVVLALAALAAGLVIAYKKSDTFRAIVDKTFAFLGKVVPQVIATVVGFVKDHWGLLVSIIGGPMGIIVVQVIKHFGAIKQFATDAVNVVIGTAKGYGRFASAVIDKVGDVVQFFKNLPGRIVGFFSDLPGQLKSLGSNIVMGLVHGIEGAAHYVTDAVQRIIDKIPKKIRSLMGIASPSKVTYELGGYIGDGLADGIAAKEGKVDSAAKKLVDKLKDKLKTAKDAMASLRDSVAGSFTGDLFSAQATAAVTDADGNVTAPAQSAAQNFISSLTSTSGTLGKLKSAFATLRKWGWKPAMLAQLFQSGNAGLILDLAADQTQANTARDLLGDIGSSSTSLGSLVGQDVYGGQIDNLNDQIKSGGKGGGGGTNNRTYAVTVNVPVNGDAVSTGREIVKTIHALERQTGRQLLVNPA